MEFNGFPVAALDFYDDLEVDNSKTTGRRTSRSTRRRSRRRWGTVAALRTEFGTSKVFRPYRDVRLAKDKTPYRPTRAPSCVWPTPPVERRAVAPGVRAAAVSTRPGGPAGRDPQGGRPRRTAPSSRGSSAGWSKEAGTLGGEILKTWPRGYDEDHPRIELLRHQSMIASRTYGFEPVIPRRAARPGPQGLARLPTAGGVERRARDALERTSGSSSNGRTRARARMLRVRTAPGETPIRAAVSSTLRSSR